MAERVPLPSIEDIDKMLKDETSARAGKTPTPPKTTAAPRAASTRKDLTSQLVQFYTMLGTVAMFAAKDKPIIAEQILNNAQNCAEEVNKLAQTNPKIHAAIVKMMSAGATGAVVTAHLPIIVAIAVSYVPQAAPLEMFLTSDYVGETSE